MKRVLIALVVAGLALAGCGGSDDNDDADAANNSGTTTPSGSNGNGDNENPDDFSSLLDLDSDAKLRVTYQYGDDEETVTISRDGSGKTAHITESTQLIQNGDEVTQCDNIDSDEPECKTISGALAQAALLGLTGFMAFPTTMIQAAQSAGKGFGDSSSEEIAGRSAECTTVTVKDIIGSVGNAIAAFEDVDTDAGYKVCADKDTGVLLLWEIVGTEDDGSRIEAIEVGDPEDSDFEPAAEPSQVTMPEITLPGGITIPGIPGANP